MAQRDGAEFHTCGIQGDPFSESAEHVHRTALAPQERCDVDSMGRPDLLVEWESESLGHDANDFSGFSIHPNELAHNGRVPGESVLPNVVSKHHDRAGIGCVFPFLERSTEMGQNPQVREGIRTHEGSGEPLGRGVVTGHVDGALVHRAQILEYGLLLPQILVLVHGHGHASDSQKRPVLIDEHQPLFTGYR